MIRLAVFDHFSNHQVSFDACRMEFAIFQKFLELGIIDICSRNSVFSSSKILSLKLDSAAEEILKVSKKSLLKNGITTANNTNAKYHSLLFHQIICTLLQHVGENSKKRGVLISSKTPQNLQVGS